MKTMLKSKLIELLNKHRDNDVYVEFDGYELPIDKVYYDSLSDTIRVVPNWSEMQAVKGLIKEKGLREKVGNAKSS